MRGEVMKLIVLPCDLLDTRPYSNIVRGKDKILFGWFTTRTILSIAKEFKIGDWIKNGCRDMPYAYWFSKENLFHDIGIKEDSPEEQEYYTFVDMCAEHGVFANQQDELNIYLEYPDMMRMVDETQMKESLKHFGKGKLTLDDVKNIMEEKKYDSRVSLEHSKEHDTKLNNNSLSNYKEDNIRDINSSSPQAPSDKGSDEDLEYWQRVGQANVDEMNRIEKDIN